MRDVSTAIHYESGNAKYYQFLASVLENINNLQGQIDNLQKQGENNENDTGSEKLETENKTNQQVKIDTQYVRSFIAKKTDKKPGKGNMPG